MIKKEISVILNNIRSRENVGSIFRTADAAGVSKIYLCGITPQPPHQKISKTALGAETVVPWEHCKQVSRLINKLKKDNMNIVALEKAKNIENIFDYKPEFPLALILGNEVEGISPAILKKCDKKIAIPMYGRKESLNVAVAFGIAVYNLISR